MRLMPLMLFPAVALVAQPPSTVDLVKRFNTELPGVNQLLKELKPQEALAKVQTLIPAQRPAFDASNAKSIVQSLDNAQGLMSLYRLYANVCSEAGLWEKAVEVQTKRAQEARATLADLEKAQAPIAAQWKKVSQESGDYVAKNTPRQQELQAELKVLREDVDAVNAKKKKLDNKGLEELKARIAKAPQKEQELDQINAALPVHKQNLVNAPKVTKILSDNHQEVEGMIKAADEAVAKANKAVSDQNDEITQFNTQQVIKKVKLVGKKNWVDAVLRVPENITKLGSPQLQAAFLNRLLVLDPGNVGAQKALDNLKAGKEAFAKEPKPTKKGAKK
jgi:myosin heavy subunit